MNRDELRKRPLMDRVGPTAVVTEDAGRTIIDDMHDTGRVFMFPSRDPQPRDSQGPPDLPERQ